MFEISAADPCFYIARGGIHAHHRIAEEHFCKNKRVHRSHYRIFFALPGEKREGIRCSEILPYLVFRFSLQLQPFIPVGPVHTLVEQQLKILYIFCPVYSAPLLVKLRLQDGHVFTLRLFGIILHGGIDSGVYF